MDVIKGVLTLVALAIFAVAAIVAVFKLAAWLWERSVALCLAVHGLVLVSGLLLVFLPDGWWSWFVGAPFAAWAVIIALWAIVVAWEMIKSWIQKVFGMA